MLECVAVETGFSHSQFGSVRWKVERWRQIESVFNAAHEKTGEERARFLDEACSGDQALRREVESLLANEDLAASFLESDGSGAAPRPQHARVQFPRASGSGLTPLWTCSARAAWVKSIRAHDKRLDRHVAIKFLSRRDGGLTRRPWSGSSAKLAPPRR